MGGVHKFPKIFQENVCISFGRESVDLQEGVWDPESLRTGDLKNRCFPILFFQMGIELGSWDPGLVEDTDILNKS